MCALFLCVWRSTHYTFEMRSVANLDAQKIGVHPVLSQKHTYSINHMENPTAAEIANALMDAPADGAMWSIVGDHARFVEARIASLRRVLAFDDFADGLPEIEALLDGRGPNGRLFVDSPLRERLRGLLEAVALVPTRVGLEVERDWLAGSIARVALPLPARIVALQRDILAELAMIERLPEQKLAVRADLQAMLDRDITTLRLSAAAMQDA